ncbi:hypothetical protein PAXRUDRAFT_149014 [Paxillus rubicundulus Ve08.2h10]|uniref:Unplaced genomic scaffold scaffold_541, whole genome shotgun sequence n=1 Tax=Paxillus rubicundulus Ve08.2h10 TaxID=930991 RepID=A0A0D0E3K1_9AGAM|nr:hypothetical protein PAXRUDRAFT_149014 [Paxillus rubicundulus Ve08.2h10]
MAAYKRLELRQWKTVVHPKRATLGQIPKSSHPHSSSGDPCFILKDLEAPIITLSIDHVTPTELINAQLSDVKSVASYSWLEAATPTIAVPGSPWIWAGDRDPITGVPLDDGVQFIHHNVTEMDDQSPMVPLFAAIDVLHEGFRYSDLDLITNRNSLRKLLRYVDNGRGLKDFRIDIDLVRDTCLFTRCEENAAIVGSWSGYGNEYLKAATRAPLNCENMTDHHRIITYNFGGLNVLLYFTADACIESDGDPLLTSFSSLSIRSRGNTLAKPDMPSYAGLDVKPTSPRLMIPQSDLIEVKTRSIRGELNWREFYPQLYLSQIPWLYVAWHLDGIFQPVEKIALDSDTMKPHAEDAAPSVGKLKVLLEDILKAVREQGSGVPLSLVCRGRTLTLWKRKEGSGKPLGMEIISKF